MTTVQVQSSFWSLFPDAQITVLVVKGINQELDKDTQQMIKDMLKNAQKTAKTYLTDEQFSENRVIKEWRQAFQQFKTKKGARASIESLFKRIDQGKEILPIEPLVDCYNSISLIHAVPIGGEDAEKIEGNIHLGQAQGGESFFPLGVDKDSPASPGEIIYYDELGAICRCLNWREAQRTMLTEQTKNAFFFIEAINNDQIKRANEAAKELQQVLEQCFHASVTSYTLDSNNPEL